MSIDTAGRVTSGTYAGIKKMNKSRNVKGVRDMRNVRQQKFDYARHEWKRMAYAKQRQSCRLFVGTNENIPRIKWILVTVCNARNSNILSVSM